MPTVHKELDATRQVMNFVVDHRAPAVEPRSFSDLFERLVWLQSDNGNNIHAVLRQWLEGEDRYRIDVALGLEETFVFDTRKELVDSFARILQRWPELNARCEEIMESWDRSVTSRD